LNGSPAATPTPQAWVMPAEWDRHDATWLAWPHNVRDWPGKFAPIPWVYAEIIRHIARDETVHLIANDARHEKKARQVLSQAGVDIANVSFHRFPTDRIWMRDAGPIFVLRGGEKAIARFRFNAWSKYQDFRRDARIPECIGRLLGVPVRAVLHGQHEVVLEGGSIDVNGSGTILTTEECLLDEAVQVRNPGFEREDYASVFRDALGAPNVIWLARGIAGDDTHGHIDDLARFTSPRTILLCREPNGRDANHRALEENRERLESARLENGSRPEVVFLPMPAPVWFKGQRLPASYANYYVCNSAVLVPTFNDPRDRIALGTLAELFHDRQVVGIHCLDLVWGLGTLHCLSQQEPRAAR